MSTRRTRAQHFAARAASAERDELLVVEEPLEIRISGDTLAVTMRTPGHDRELALGLLFSEGIVSSRDDVGSLAHCGRPGDDGFGNTLEVTPAAGGRFDLERAGLARRGTLVSSACGVCGRRSIDDLLARTPRLPPDARFSRAAVSRLTSALGEQQPLFAHTGGLHAAAVANASSELEHVREDVGRHNAVDKIVGRLLLDAALPAAGKVLVVSGRVSFEIVQKAVLAGFPALVAVSAPTSLAVETAVRAGLTLIGFARGESFNVYSGPERLAP